jgi:nucleotide-binding universal stress UspA family protein
MRIILVPLDGSTFAEAALPAALEIARSARAELRLVQVHEWRLPPLDSDAWLAADQEVEAAVRAEEQAYLDAVAARCTERAGIRASAELLEGDTVTALSRYALDADVDLVVMTTHGRGGLSRVWIGSVADALIRSCERPILLVRPRDAGAPAAEFTVRRVLVPLDGSGYSEGVLPAATSIAALYGASIALFHALPQPRRSQGNGLRPEHIGAGREQRRLLGEYLDEVAARLRADGHDVRCIVRDHSVPALAVLDEAGAVDGTLVAMATHGRGGWSRVALGSVADKVLRASDAPVLIFRPAADADARAAAIPTRGKEEA